MTVFARRGRPPRVHSLGAGVLALALLLAGCAADTGRLPASMEERLAAAGIVHRARNLAFRHSRDTGGYDARWRDVVASIVVTRETVLIHRNEQELLRLSPRTRREVEVRRAAGRIRIRLVGARNSETWSFMPPDSGAEWAAGIRAVLRGGSASPGD